MSKSRRKKRTHRNEEDKADGRLASTVQLGDRINPSSPRPVHFDVFISHASEDKDDVARPLARALIDRGLRVWLDELVLTVGDSLNRSINAGLAHSRFGVVVLSPAFFAKEWPQRELDGLTAREVERGTKVILPVWHNIDQHFLLDRAPTLADRLGVPTDRGLLHVTEKIFEALNRVEDAARDPQRSESDSQTHARPANFSAAAGRRAKTQRVALTAVLTLSIGFGTTFLIERDSGSADPLNATASNALLEVSLPASWQRATAVPPLAGFQLTDALALRSRLRSSGELTLGVQATQNPTLLPVDYLRRLPSPPQPEVVHLAHATFLRYSRLHPRGVANPQAVYALRSTTGTLLGVCSLPAVNQSRAQQVCERIVNSLTLVEAKALPIAPDAAYAKTLRDTLSRLNGDRAQAERMLAEARRATTQAVASQQLATAYTQATETLRKAEPSIAERPTNAHLVASLAHAAYGYKTMARGARINDPLTYGRGRSVVKSATGVIAETLSREVVLGYELGESRG